MTVLKRAFISGMIAGIIFAIMLVISVILHGDTFGQRCATLHESGSPEWNQCVQRLSEGKPLT